MIAAEAVTDRGNREYIEKIILPVFESVLIEKRKEQNKSLKNWI